MWNVKKLRKRFAVEHEDGTRFTMRGKPWSSDNEQTAEIAAEMLNLMDSKYSSDDFVVRATIIEPGSYGISNYNRPIMRIVRTQSAEDALLKVKRDIPDSIRHKVYQRVL